MILEVALFAVLAASPAATTEQEVRDVEARFNAAYAANDMTTYWSFYDEALTQWWPEGRVDLPTYKTQWTKLLTDGGKVISNTLSDVRVHVSPSGDAAVASYKARVVTRQADGKVTDEIAQETDVLFKKSGAWKVMHIHYDPKPAK
jgi:ketosteroid isomerase-like protein